MATGAFLGPVGAFIGGIAGGIATYYGTKAVVDEIQDSDEKIVKEIFYQYILHVDTFLLDQHEVD